ncbi:ACT domain-containing protein [Ammonifex thiophilus]|uniref:ACT domain-containing protein n=1 Tax=Ammonifex thiophilus TaxID=444093 RepID=UPI00196A8E58|nr:ACT domain-containing protein [Ammonifex thiophilus]
MEKNWRMYASLDADHYLSKVVLMVPDRPGMLESIASAFAARGVNITYTSITTARSTPTGC